DGESRLSVRFAQLERRFGISFIPWPVELLRRDEARRRIDLLVDAAEPHFLALRPAGDPTPGTADAQVALTVRELPPRRAATPATDEFGLRVAVPHEPPRRVEHAREAHFARGRRGDFHGAVRHRRSPIRR